MELSDLLGNFGLFWTGAFRFWLFKNSPQCLHLIAEASISSPQKGQVFTGFWGVGG